MSKTQQPRKPTPRQEASATDTPAQRLDELAADPKLARLVAANPSSSAELLLELSHSDDKSVRKACTSNANTPVEALLKLGSQFPEQLLENPVFDLLLLAHPGLFEELPTSTLNSLLKRDQVPVELIRWASQKRARECTGAILMNPHSPEDVVIRLAESSDSEISTVAKSHIQLNAASMSENINDIFQDRDTIISLLSRRQTDFATCHRKIRGASGIINSMPSLDLLSSEQYMLAGDIAIAPGIKRLPPRYRFRILETVLSLWSEYRPKAFDKALATLTPSERNLANQAHGLKRKNYQGATAEVEPRRTTRTTELPSSQEELLQLAMDQPDHKDIETVVNKLEEKAFEAISRMFLVTGYSQYLNHTSLFCAVMAHPLAGIDKMQRLAEVAKGKRISLLGSYIEAARYPDETTIRILYMEEVDSWLLRFAAAPRPGPLRLFSFFHERCPAKLLARNIRSSDWLERYAIASNKSSPIQSLAILARDGVGFVSRAAEANLEERAS